MLSEQSAIRPSRRVQVAERIGGVRPIGEPLADQADERGLILRILERRPQVTGERLERASEL